MAALFEKYCDQYIASDPEDKGRRYLKDIARRIPDGSVGLTGTWRLLVLRTKREQSARRM